MTNLKEFYSIHKKNFNLKREFDNLSKSEKEAWKKIYHELLEIILEMKARNYIS